MYIFKFDGLDMGRVVNLLMVTSILASQPEMLFAGERVLDSADVVLTHSVTHAPEISQKPTTQDDLDKYVAVRKAAAEKARKLSSWEEINVNDPHWYAKTAYMYSSGAVKLGAELAMPWVVSAGLRLTSDVILGVTAPYILQGVGTGASSIVSKLPFAPEWLSQLSSGIAQGETMRHFGTLASGVDASIVPVSYSLWGLADSTYALGTRVVYRALGLAHDAADEKAELDAISGRFRLDGQRTFTQDELDEYFLYALRREAYNAKVASWKVLDSKDPHWHLKQLYNTTTSLGGVAFNFAAPFLTSGAVRLTNDVLIGAAAPTVLSFVGSASEKITSSAVSHLPLLGSHISSAIGKIHLLHHHRGR